MKKKNWHILDNVTISRPPTLLQCIIPSVRPYDYFYLQQSWSLDFAQLVFRILVNFNLS